MVGFDPKTTPLVLRVLDKVVALGICFQRVLPPLESPLGVMPMVEPSDPEQIKTVSWP